VLLRYLKSAITPHVPLKINEKHVKNAVFSQFFENWFGRCLSKNLKKMKSIVESS
jgi:hypothetical protein